MSNQTPPNNPSTRRTPVESNSKTDPAAPITLEDTLMGTDPPIEDAHPGLQPALVFASYPIALVVLISVVAIYFAFFRSAPEKYDASPNQAEISK